MPKPTKIASRKFCFLVICTILYPFATVFGQQVSYFDTNSGLLNNKINSICLDSHGFLWLATDKGIQLFDRNNKVAKSIFQEGSINGMLLHNNVIHYIEEAPDGKIWVATDNGLGIIDLESRSIITLFSNENDKKSINKIVFDSRGGAYLMSHLKLFYLNKDFESININFDNVRWIHDVEIDDQSLYALITDNNLERKLLSIDANHKIMVHNFSRSNFISQESWEESEKWVYSDLLKYVFIQSILFKNSEGNVYLKWKPYHKYFKLDVDADLVIQELKEKEIKEQIPFYNFCKQNNIEERAFENDPKLRQSFFGMKKGLWIFGESEFSILKDLEGDSFRNIFEFPDSSLILSTYESISRLNLRNGELFKKKYLAPLLCMTSLDSSIIISGVDPQGICQVNTTDLTVEMTNLDKLQYVSSILKKSKSTIYIAHSGGISIGEYTILNNRVNIDLKKRYLDSIRVNTLVSAGEDRIIIGSEEGLYYMNIANGIHEDERISKTKFTEQVISVIQDRTNNNWLVGTINNGVYILDENFNTIAHKNINNGLIDNRITSISSISDSVFWVCSFDGISALDETGTVLRNISTKELIWIEEFNRFSNLITSDSIMYFGGTNGAIYFSPQEANLEKEGSRVFVSEIVLINKKSKGDTIIYNFRNEIEDLKVSPYNKSIEFKMSSSDYTKPLSYNYRLLGFENKWNESSSPSIRYTNLKSGEYQFEISKMKQILEPQKNESIKLTKPVIFYNSIWFYFLVFILSAAIIGIISAKIIYAREKLRKLKENVSADLHDDLGYTLTKIHRNVQSLKKEVIDQSKGDEFDQVLQSSLVGINSLSRIIWILDDEDKSINEVFEKVRVIFSEILDEGQHFESQLLIDDDVPAKNLKAEYCNHLIMIAKEAANNIQKHAVSEVVSVKLHLEPQYLNIDFFNTYSKRKTPLASTKKGIENMKRRVNEMKGDINIENQNNKFSISIKLKIK